MYLSRLLLNPENSDGERDFASPYEIHRTLGRAFLEAETKRYRSECGVLFRIEESSMSHGIPVLVQSTSIPDWSRLPQGYALRLDGPKPFEPALREDRLLRFRLVANPVRRIRIEGKKHPRRYALVHPEAKEGVEDGYLDWLTRQAEAGGFTVVDVTDAPFRLDRKRRVGAEEIAKPRIPHFGVRFDGVLRVTEPEKLIDAVRKGIGPAKAFGFGLLSLAAVR